SQPVKLAAIEGLARTTRGASEHVLGWYTDDRVRYGIAIPKLLSLLAYHDPNATVRGLDTVPAGQRPPVNVVRVAFQAMVGIGTLLALLGAVYLWVRARRKRLPESRWFYRAVVVAGPLSVVALVGADFGAGSWQLGAGRGPHADRIRDHAHHAMAPVWEANHVWLIFVLTVFWTAYPVAFGSIMSTLAIPLFVAALGIILRGTT